MKKPGPNDSPELHEKYKRKLESNLKSYRKRYDNDKNSMIVRLKETVRESWMNTTMTQQKGKK